MTRARFYQSDLGIPGGRDSGRPAGDAHSCDEYCVCPEHRTPMIYWPSGDEHACQDVNCEYGHGVSRALAAQEYRRNALLVKECRSLTAEVIAGLTTDAHGMTAVAGLPVCRCGVSLGSGDASGDFITHALAALAAERLTRAPSPANWHAIFRPPSP